MKKTKLEKYLEDLKSRDVKLFLKDGVLNYDAPTTGSLTDVDISVLSENRQQIIQVLEGETLGQVSSSGSDSKGTADSTSPPVRIPPSESYGKKRKNRIKFFLRKLDRKGISLGLVDGQVRVLSAKKSMDSWEQARFQEFRDDLKKMLKDQIYSPEPAPVEASPYEDELENLLSNSLKLDEEEQEEEEIEEEEEEEIEEPETRTFIPQSSKVIVTAIEEANSLVNRVCPDCRKKVLRLGVGNPQYHCSNCKLTFDISGVNLNIQEVRYVEHSNYF